MNDHLLYYLLVYIRNHHCIQLNVNPKGVAVHVSAEHHCMSSRGVHKSNVDMITTHFTGEFNENSKAKKRFLSSLKHN